MNLDLLIELKTKPTIEKPSKKTPGFQSVCGIFGSSMVKNQGLWATGPFRSFKCASFSEKKKPVVPPGNRPDWRLEISSNGEFITFTMFFRESNDTESEISSYRIESPLAPIALLAKKNLNQLIAFQLSSSLPFRSAIPWTNSSLDGTNISGPKGPLSQMTPPEEFVVFEASRLSGLWKSKPVGIAKIHGESDGKVRWKIEGIGTRPVPPPGEYYLVQQTNGRDEILTRSDQLIKDEVGNLIDGLFNFGKSAYVGARYGIPIGGEGLLKNASMIGIFADLRSGLGSGVKLNYDLIPSQKFENEQGSQAFQWSRFQVGYSFLRQVNWGLLTQIDATPKIGVTSLKYSLSPADDTNVLASNFEITRAPTVGLELGTEKNTFLARLRFWAFTSFSMGVLSADKNQTSTSTRVGIDAYRELFKLGGINVAILGFSAIESTKITKKGASTGSSSASSLEFNHTYIGGGSTLTW
jgi:hypothetical protein